MFKSVKKTAKILAVLILVFTAIFFLLCKWKYSQFGYDGLDLAIFNQVFFNTIHGNLFAFTIHPSSYLGDHAEFIILLLAPLYALWQSPLCLLLLQALMISLCAWPLFLIAKKVLAVNWAFFIACLWLINPFLQNMTLYEFHILPFAMFTLLWMFYFWQAEKFKPFLLFLFLSLLVREDVALVVMFFGIMSWVLKRRQFKWSILPFILGGVWFYLVMKVIAHFAPDGSYKFLELYSWLGNTPLEMIKNIFAHPLGALLHVATYNNISLLVVLSLFFVGLNFFAWFYLIPIIPILAQIVLGGYLNSLIVLQTHYISLLLVFWFISLIYGLKKIFTLAQNKNNYGLGLKNIKELSVVILLITTIYFSWQFGFITSFFQTVRDADTKPLTLQQDLLKKITNDQPVVASYNFLPNFSNRQYLYSSYYVYVGHKQFSKSVYNLPENTEVIAIDFQEPLIYWLRRNNNDTYKQDYLNGTKNWANLFTGHDFKVTDLQDTFALLKKQQVGIELYAVNPQEVKIEKPLKAVLDDNLSLAGVSSWNGVSNAQDFLPLSFIFKTKDKQIKTDYQFRLSLLDKNNQELYKKDYLLGYGVYPATQWSKDSIILMNYNFWLPPALKAKNPTIICWEFFDGQGNQNLNRFGSIELVILDYQPIIKSCLCLDQFTR